MAKHMSPLTRWMMALLALVSVAQAAWFCGCAGMNYYPSDEDDRLRKVVESRVNADPEVQRIMRGHGDWGTKDGNKLRIYLGYDEWSYNYGYARMLPRPQTAEERAALGMDAFGRIKDKPFTAEELDVLAARVAAASMQAGVKHKIEFVDQVQERTTRVIGPQGAWVKTK